MRTRLSSVTITAALLVGCGFDCREYADERAGFAVCLPGSPTVRIQALDGAVLHWYGVTPQPWWPTRTPQMYAAGYVEVPAPAAVDSLLEQSGTAVLVPLRRDLNVTVEARQASTHQGRPALVMLLKRPNGTVGRLMLVAGGGKTAFYVLVLGPRDAVESAEAGGRVLSSLRLLAAMQ